MYTFGQYVKDKVQEGVELGKAQGVELGKARGEVQGEKRVLLKFVRQVWGASEAERFARELDAADLRDLPDITDLMEDQDSRSSPAVADKQSRKFPGIGPNTTRGCMVQSACTRIAPELSGHPLRGRFGQCRSRIVRAWKSRTPAEIGMSCGGVGSSLPNQALTDGVWPRGEGLPTRQQFMLSAAFYGVCTVWCMATGVPLCI